MSADLHPHGRRATSMRADLGHRYPSVRQLRLYRSALYQIYSTPCRSILWTSMKQLLPPLRPNLERPP
jgi:hypothetical protein